MSANKHIERTATRRQRGFSLVEILVGVLIGMIGIVVIFQVLAVAEQRKRNTTSGGDAQSAGSIGLYLLQRDAQLAGYGFGTAHSQHLGCTVHVYDKDRPTESAAGSLDFPLVPALITQGVGNAPDTITFVKGNPTYSVTHREFTLKTGTDKASPLVLKLGRAGLDWGNVLVMAVRPDTGLTTGVKKCALIQVTHLPDGATAVPGDPYEIQHLTGYQDVNEMLPLKQLPGGATTTPKFNQASYPTNTEFDGIDGYLYDLGKQPRRTIWAACSDAAIADANSPCFGKPQFRNKLITKETMFGFPEEEAADGIINLQAEYGIDQNFDNMIGANEWTVLPPDLTQSADPLNNLCKPTRPSWRCLRAIRVAMLARSAFFDKTACSPNPQWTSGAGGVLALTNFAMTDVNGPNDTFGNCNENPPSPNNWRRYRYRVYETVIPMRNMIWGTQPGVEYAGGGG
jgi:type IV pilus assembly protein PilW